jgi:hypothetical protein
MARPTSSPPSPGTITESTILGISETAVECTRCAGPVVRFVLADAPAFYECVSAAEHAVGP